MSAVVSGLIGGVIAAGLGALAVRSQKSARTHSDGWMKLRPGWYLHLLLILCWAFVALIAYFFWTGGSTRADAQEQNFYALLILIASAAAGIWTLCSAYLREVGWKDDEIRVSAPWRRERLYRFSDITDVKGTFDGSGCKLRFGEHGKLNVSAYFHGFQDFTDELRRRTVLDGDGRAP
jgi:hypothetical protein